MVDLSDSYILLSETFKQTLLDYYGIKSKKIIAITNPISSEKQYKFKSQAKEKIVLFVGRLTKQKGVNYLIDIWKIIEKNHHDWKLMIIGDGEERNFIEKKISKYNLKNIHIEGYQSDVYSYYRKASILFMTSIFEGFGLVLAEAMSYGVVPIAFNSYESISDIIDHNFNGFSVSMYLIKERQAEIAVANGNFDEAIQFLEQAKKYAIEYDKVKETQKGKFTCLLLDHYEDDYTDSRIESLLMDSWKKEVFENKIFDVLRESEEFQSLINE
jgi:glycosyltransferase involved in cell wall biosynthesis